MKLNSSMKSITHSHKNFLMNMFTTKFPKKRRRNQKEAEEDDLYIHEHYNSNHLYFNINYEMQIGAEMPFQNILDIIKKFYY